MPSVTGTLVRLEVASTNFSATSGYGALAIGAHFALVGGNGVGAPETPETGRPALEEWYVASLPPPPPPSGPASQPITLWSKLHPTLSTDKIYWIVAMPGGYDDCVAWHRSSYVSSAGDLSSQDGGHTWLQLSSEENDQAPAFAVWVKP
jgi:hypothetical protein